ncbi:hypothetical protein A3I46_03060 [Candidatus Kaiserbacteria bacterium RIFCSPLOWO2_02_FULL_54_13]|uniref:Endolytic murein transglycosylase n=1 Tax=Candidatus Kaiserbacteria bacterium RIFCSPHIGHO2_02_FULL_54_22 TaxID=1798495 RepID=A0A1F6DNG0_9BACT|nr:MAG: hypothetical protein A3C19_02405 [Candidatus Kaiserbacteria bacterium RIFCSPHIGHO2_02_FULL_54_22]OGG68005.1 MAG: hypothetical protein A3E99_01820 [Candidatus Kaiserbacteria bacterium RIFCSPHIGHO2_12_FULL_54_16]OGG83533.1 MAG: hypothetical protein A3I46_03060 [Candidatus Kaiserbacteria bacterium RIFCSPLOWO2_02_FULL_54_13]OGG90064.1 MAG: hypothetical protein A3G12_00485 [Candidatus Kaiserbacteria bacterium RIFCSPLOWO2_12_FULL_54_10]
MYPVRDKNLESSGSPSASVSNGMEFFKRYISWAAPFALAGFLFIGYVLAFAPPQDFLSGSIVVVARGTGVSEVARELSDAHIIKHPAVLQFVLRASGASARVRSGAYLFSTPENVLVIAQRLATGDYNIPPVRITFPEGITVRDIAARVSNTLPLISAEDFISAGKPYEGYLFPDTYFFPPSYTAAPLIDAMRKNFDAKIATLSDDIQASGHSLSDIIIMASLIEKEVRTVENRRIVAGILWSRLALGMPLQVDAVFGYIFNRDTYSPPLADLKVDSPYNTYTHKGLPPGPINNPGLASIQAVLHPTKTDYLYYLVDKNGVIYYATTYAAHQANRHEPH